MKQWQRQSVFDKKNDKDVSYDYKYVNQSDLHINDDIPRDV